MNANKIILINSLVEMADFAKSIATQSYKGDVYCLSGTLGAGKSFFAKNFINSLRQEPAEVLSPTFNLVYSYETTKEEVFHFDLYRLKSEDELENIGFFDAIKSGICLIEWPEIAKKYLNSFTEINIKIISENIREIEVVEIKK